MFASSGSPPFFFRRRRRRAWNGGPTEGPVSASRLPCLLASRGVRVNGQGQRHASQQLRTAPPPIHPPCARTLSCPRPSPLDWIWFDLIWLNRNRRKYECNYKCPCAVLLKTDKPGGSAEPQDCGLRNSQVGLLSEGPTEPFGSSPYCPVWVYTWSPCTWPPRVRESLHLFFRQAEMSLSVSRPADCRVPSRWGLSLSFLPGRKETGEEGPSRVVPTRPDRSTRKPRVSWPIAEIFG